VNTINTPRLEIDLDKIRHNTSGLIHRFQDLGISITGVTKASLGSPEIARAMLSGGVKAIGDSRIENIQRMKNAGINAPFILLRSPQISRVDDVVRFADISLNSELAVIEQLSAAAQRLGKRHRIILMVELGDLREGISPLDIDNFVDKCLKFSHLDIEGIGTNLTCFSGVKPDDRNMAKLGAIADRLQTRFGLNLVTISGGNSATLNWLFNTRSQIKFNNLRLGESILLGRETLYQESITDLHQDAITLVTSVIESQVKPSMPRGDMVKNAFGVKPVFEQRGDMLRCILDVGQQDVQLDGIQSLNPNISIVGASSDHLVVDASLSPLSVGSELKFSLNYAALLAAMTSPFVKRLYLGKTDP